jgi:hypothetical protein
MFPGRALWERVSTDDRESSNISASCVLGLPTAI